MNSNSTDTKEIRKFGTIALVFFGCLACLGFWRQKIIIAYFFSFLSFIGLTFLLLPSTLSPVYEVWMKITHLIGRIITTLTLALAYYLVITPFGLVKRLFGDRPLPLKPDPSVSSYWVPRSEPAQPKEGFIKRY